MENQITQLFNIGDNLNEMYPNASTKEITQLICDVYEEEFDEEVSDKNAEIIYNHYNQSTMNNSEQQIFNKLIELGQAWPTIHFDTLEESGKYEGIYYTRGIGEAIEEWIDGEEICEGSLVDVTIYWDPSREEAELIVEPYAE